MLKELNETLLRLPELLKSTEGWQSLVINRRKPATYRAFRNLENFRVCLHRFETCDEQESFFHPHPWEGAFAILKGSYLMNIGYSETRESAPREVCKTLMSAGSKYSITNPLTWHSVTPLEECYTVMVNKAPWAPEIAHKEVRTTVGKDLQKMSDLELQGMFLTFNNLLK